MITIVGIISISIMLHNYHLFLVFGIIKFQCLRKFHGYNTTLLSILTTLCITSPGYGLFTNCKFVPLNNISPTHPPHPR